jgi:cysteine desulfurase/selenocysteine lyase
MNPDRAQPAAQHAPAQTAAVPMDVDAVRADFPILHAARGGRPLAYLDNAATTHKPRPVLDRVLAFYTEANSNVHRGAHALSAQASAWYEAARETVRGFIGARDTREIVFTHGTTDAINMVADCFEHDRLQPGDDIIITELEHHSNLVPWQMLCARTGARLQVLPFDDDGTLHIDALAGLLTDRTRLVTLAHVSNVLGRVNPVAEVARIAHARGVPVLVDAAQSVPHIPIDVQSLGCDLLVFSGHKLYAETGIGVLYGTQAWLERLQPRRYGGGMVDSVGFDKTTFAAPPTRFEAGTPNIAGAVSLAAAIEYIQAIGLDAIGQHERTVMQHAMTRLAALDGVRVYGTGPDKCGVIALNLAGLDAYDVALILDQLGVAVRSGTHCAAPVMRHFGVAQSLRASLALYNTMDDVDRLIAGLERARTLLS